MIVRNQNEYTFVCLVLKDVPSKILFMHNTLFPLNQASVLRIFQQKKRKTCFSGATRVGAVFADSQQAVSVGPGAVVGLGRTVGSVGPGAVGLQGAVALGSALVWPPGAVALVSVVILAAVLATPTEGPVAGG